MKTLNEVVKNPSGWDSLGNYIGETSFDGWNVLLTHSRDSDTLTESNFISALELLGGESDNVQIHRFGHWACGWWEALVVLECTPQYAVAQRIYDDLQDYPVVNEEHFSNMEWEVAQEYWEGLNIKERVELCQEHDCNIFGARHDYIPQDDSGSLFEYLVN